MAGGSALSTFNDFALGTNYAQLSDQNSFINEGMQNRHVFGRFLRSSSDPSKTFQGGSDIRDSVMFDAGSTAINYKPNTPRSYTNNQTKVQFIAPWRFTSDYMTWTEQEVELQNGTVQQVKLMYKSVLKGKEQATWTSLLNHMEDTLLRVPIGANYGPAQMEAATGQEPYSIFAFVNYETNGLYTGWTTKEQLSPTTYTKWQPATEDYNYSNVLADNATGLLRAVDDLALAVQYEDVPFKAEYFEGPYSPGNNYFFCSDTGLNDYRQALRTNQDSFVSRQDPLYNNPRHGAVPFHAVSRLGTQSIWDNGTATEAGASNAGSRYVYVDMNYLYPVFHSDKYFSMKPIMQDVYQPETYVRTVHCWWNLVCKSMRRQGVISPDS